MRNRLWLFYAVTSFFWFSLYAYVPYVSPFADEMGADLRLIGLIAGAYGFTQMVIRFPLGIFSDRIGARKVFVLLGMGFAAASGIVVFFFPSPQTLLLARALGGVAASAWVTFTVLGASYYPPDETARSMGYLSACNSFGRMAALLVGGLVAEWLGVPHAFLLGGIAGIVGLIMGVGVVEVRPDKNGAPPPSLSTLLDVAKNKQLLCCSILGILAMFILFATTFGFTPLAAAQLDASQFQLGMLGVASTLPGIFVAPLAGTVLPKKLGVGVTIAAGFILAGAGSAFIASSNTLFMLFTVQIIGNIGGAVVGTLLLGLCIRDISAERRATAMGFFQAVYGLGMFLGPFVMGQVSHNLGLMTAFIFIGAVGVIGAVMTIVSAGRGYLKY